MQADIFSFLFRHNFDDVRIFRLCKVPAGKKFPAESGGGCGAPFVFGYFFLVFIQVVAFLFQPRSGLFFLL